MPSTNDSYSFTTAITTLTTIVMLNCGGVRAQVVSDGTTNTKVTVDGNISSITGGTQSGQNLFHSFEQFSLTTDTAASFNHALEVENIFSRVTGGISEIDGLIQTQGNANLFFLNPAGIIFGANAQLDVGGSFVASTGDRVIFKDGVEFSAVNPEKPLLTISSPMGLQYGNDVGEIAVLPNTNRVFGNSGLSVQPGNTLALLGGDVSINRNSLNGIGSNIEIGSINSGRIELLAHDNGWQFDYTNAKDLGKIDLVNRALVNSSGIVNFQGKTINLLTGSGIRSFTDLNGTAGTITLEATESIDLNGGLLITQVGQRTDIIDKAIAGIGGDILLKAPQISFSNGSLISAGTLSDGAGGNITIDASGTVKLFSEVGKPSIISTSTQGTGDGGQIEINTGSLTIEDGSQIQALAGEGAGGTITVKASEAVNISGTGILRSPNAEGNLSETELTSGFSASSGIDGLPLVEQPQGQSGNIVIDTPNLTIEDEAQISVSNYGIADAGDIKINASTLNLDTAGEIVANTASGEGGSIGAIAEELVILDEESSISTTADRDGNGGNITIETDNLVLLESNKISADASQGNGGRITINAQGLFVEPSSSITASSEDEGKIGSVEIFTSDLNSRLQTDYQVQSSFVAEDRVYTGCGVGEDLTENQFRDIGRGGIPNNPMQEIVNRETLDDLGTNYQKISKSVKHKQNSVKQPIPNYQPITEANAWIVERGVIKLITQPTATARRSPICSVN